MKGPTTYIKEAWGIYFKKENFIFFAKVMAVVVIASSLIGFVMSYFYPADYLEKGDYSNTSFFIGFIILTVLTALVGLWTQTTTYFAIFKTGNSEKEICGT